MRKIAIAFAPLLAGLLALSGSAAARPDAAGGAAKKPDTVEIQLVTISDWHGQLVPLADIDFVASGNQPGGGAAVLKAYLDQARATNPNTLVFMAGDSWGATPPISSFFEDAPAVVAMNMMGVTADTFGNHNFDRGIDHLQSQIDLAEFDFVSTNLRHLKRNLKHVDELEIYKVGGVKIAVIGITNEEAPTLVAPGSLGTIEIEDSVKAANKAAKKVRKEADVVVVLTHKGIRGTSPAPNGELIDFANAVDPDLIDVIVGDHTNFSYNAVHQGSILVVENLSKGAQFTKVQLTVDRKDGVVASSATQHPAFVSAVTPDPAISAYIAGLNAVVAPILGTVIGEATVAVPRSDSCGRPDGRLCESRVGNVVTDAIRTTYGTDFALTNAGGLRADLTCPGAGTAGFCPAAGPTPPFPITRGSVLGVLPFGNFSVTLDLTGAELKSMLEHGVSSMPSANGRFAQVSGLCFTYDIASAVGSRVTSIVEQAPGGSCAGPAISPTATYSLATNDFTAIGGDGYPNFLGRFSSLGVTLDTDVANYIAAGSPISPSIQGRIVCADSNGATAPNCPAITAP
ncbi:MAG: 5'-nucleotidase C-terminal domain-containing protein [Gaiellaceae bacterium]